MMPREYNWLMLGCGALCLVMGLVPLRLRPVGIARLEAWSATCLGVAWMLWGGARLVDGDGNDGMYWLGMAAMTASMALGVLTFKERRRLKSRSTQ